MNNKDNKNKYDIVKYYVNFMIDNYNNEKDDDISIIWMKQYDHTNKWLNLLSRSVLPYIERNKD